MYSGDIVKQEQKHKGVIRSNDLQVERLQNSPQNKSGLVCLLRSYFFFCKLTS